MWINKKSFRVILQPVYFSSLLISFNLAALHLFHYKIICTISKEICYSGILYIGSKCNFFSNSLKSQLLFNI